MQHPCVLLLHGMQKRITLIFINGLPMSYLRCFQEELCTGQCTMSLSAEVWNGGMVATYWRNTLLTELYINKIPYLNPQVKVLHVCHCIAWDVNLRALVRSTVNRYALHEITSGIFKNLEPLYNSIISVRKQNWRIHWHHLKNIW
jgi:hypothetical protein